MDTPFQRRILSLDWPGFRTLVLTLQLDIYAFSEGWPPRQWLVAFENATVAADIAPDRVTAVLCGQFQVASADLLDALLLKALVKSAGTTLAQTAVPSSSKPLIDDTAVHINCIRSAKRIHDLSQHQIASMLPGIVLLAKDAAVKPAARKAVAATLTTILSILKTIITCTSRLQASPFKANLEVLNNSTLRGMNGLIKDLQEDTAVDLLSVLQETMGTHITQVPSCIQSLLGVETTSIRWADLSKLAETADGSQPFKAIETHLWGLIQEQSEWQFVHNKLVRVNERQDALFAATATALIETRQILKGLLDCGPDIPATATIIPLVQVLCESLAEAVLDERLVSSQIENLGNLVNAEFRTADDKLLDACATLEGMSDALKSKQADLS